MKSKIILGLILFGVVILLLGGAVRAEVTAENISVDGLKQYLNELEAIMQLDIKESEFEQAENLIKNKIINNIDDTNENEKVELVVRLGGKNEYRVINNIKQVYIAGIRKNGEVVAEKEALLNYSNSARYNALDLDYIERVFSNNMKFPRDIEGRYIIEDYIELGKKPQKSVKDLVEEKINDNSITLIANGGSGTGSELGSIESTYSFLIFKDDIHYGKMVVDYKGILKITVPDAIEDTEDAYIKFAKLVLEPYIKNIDNILLRRVEGDKYEIYDRSDGDKLIDTIVIKKANSTGKINNNKVEDNTQVNNNIIIIALIIIVTIIVAIIIVFVIKKMTRK